jgi:large subunit ribosomal protein L17
MKHGIKQKKLGRTSTHRKSLFINMANSLFQHERIATTLPKAKALRPVAEKLITLAKKNTLHARKSLITKLQSTQTAENLIATIAPRFKKRAGGYTRIIKTGYRKGDAAPTAIIELVDFDPIKVAESKAKKATDSSTGQKVEG